MSQPSFSSSKPAFLANSPLNLPLYNALVTEFGEVGISHAGEQRKVVHTPDPSRGGKFSARTIQYGEQYVINCPFCGDSRRRCNVNYECGKCDSRTNNSGWHLFHCFNEPCHTKQANWDRFRGILQRAGYNANNSLPLPNSFASTSFQPQTVPCRLPDNLIPLHWLPDEHKALAYLRERSISPFDVSIRYGVCYCEENKTVKPDFDHRLVIPVYGPRAGIAAAGDQALSLPEVELVGWQARSLVDSTRRKYLNPSGFKKSHCLYGLSEALVTCGPVVICEGVTDAWKIGPGALALFGKTISNDQIRLLNRYFADRSILILLDRDARNEAHDIRTALTESGRRMDANKQIVLASLPEGYDDPGECPRKALIECLENALGGSGPSPTRVSPYGVLDGIRKYIKPAALAQIGTSTSVIYTATARILDEVEFAPPVGVALVGQDNRPHYIVRGAKKILASLGACRRIYYDSLFARRLELREGLPAPACFEDLSIMAHLLDENDAYDLPVLARRFLPEGMQTPHSVVNPAVPAVAAAINDALLIRQIWDEGQLQQQIMQQGLDFLYRQIELPVIAPLADMMEHGVPFDAAWLNNHRQECLQKAAAQEEKITALTNLKFDAAKDAAVRQFLAELNLPGAQYSKDHQTLVNKEALQALIGAHPAIEPLVEARKQNQSAKTAAALLGHIDESTGRVYCKLDPVKCNTGRILCSEPNMQGLPAELRGAVVAGPGKSLVYADWSQFELRILAHYAQEPAFVEVYQSGNGDIHRRTAGSIFGKQPGEVTAEERKVGKTINFSIMNGLTCHGLASDLRISVAEAEAFMETFFAKYPQISAWIDEAIETAKANGFTSSLYYRRRHLPDLRSQDRDKASAARRQVVSGIIQATGADIFKWMLGRLYRELPSGCKLLLPIHDAILLEVNVECAEQAASLVRRVMRTPPPNFSIPLVADVHIGKNWGECAGS